VPDALRSSRSIVSDAIDNGEASSQQYLVVALCLFFNMLDGFDITAMAVVASAVSTDLDLTTDKVGWIFSFALFGMMLGAMFLAPIADVIGRRKIVIVTIVIVGSSVFLTATATSLYEFIALRFLSGLGAGALLASQTALTAEYSPKKYRALSVSIVLAGYPLGAMMTSVVAGFILPEYGWRGMFWFGGAVTLAMVIVALALVPESLKYLLDRRPANALLRANKILKRLQKQQMDELPEVQRDQGAASPGVLEGMFKLVREPHRGTTFVLWTTFFLSFSALYFLMSWLPKLMEHAGFSAVVGREAFLVLNMGGVTGIFLLGLLSTRISLSHLVSSFLVLAAILMVVFAAMPAQRIGLLVVITFIGAFLQGGFTGLYAVAANVYPTEIRSTGIGWGIGLGRSGAVVGPAVAGYLIAAGLSTSANFVIFAVPLLLSGVFAYYLRVR
jgi:AAHS family 4-hydroxybenzoate transporter-like MFS transporter